MGIRDKLKRLEHAAGEDTVLALCRECGEERRIREGIMLDLMVLMWELGQEDAPDELPADTPSDVRWVYEHPCDSLLLRDKQTGESIFGSKWEEAARAMGERETDEE